MRYIDLNSQTNVKLVMYPDNQPHIQLAKEVGIYQKVCLTVSLTDSNKVLQMMMVANALERTFNEKDTLRIPYLMTARFDRVMEPGDSLDLEVMSNIINSLNFREVHLFDVHSNEACLAIKRSINFNNGSLLELYTKEEAVLICPDGGATKRIPGYLSYLPNVVDVVYCNKARDLSNGNLTIKVMNPELCKNRNCVIVDDLCDGGGTFLGIADQIDPKHLSLIVSHGIFSKGFELLEKEFDQIITTDSLRRSYDSNLVEVVKIFN